MKKVLAIILCVTMLFSVLAINTFADTTPTVTLITNEGSPVETGVSTYFTVRFDNFQTIKGMDVIVSSPDATIGEFTATGFNNLTLTSGDNFIKSDNEIHIVDLTGGANGKITFEVTAPDATAEITVSGKYADSGTTLFEISNAVGNISVKEAVVSTPVEPEEGDEITEETPVIITQPEPEEGQAAPTTFIPYGSVYKEDAEGNIIFAEKDEDGSFTVTEEGYQVESFKVPENKITTFGVSENTADSTALRFGNYSLKGNEATSHGTMVFEGNWLALKNYYIKKGYTVQQLLAAIYKAYDTAITGANYVYFSVPGTEEKVNVYKFKQNKHMWKNETDGILEYAIRLSGVKASTTYTAAAYCFSETDVVISEEVQSVTRPDAQ